MNREDLLDAVSDPAGLEPEDAAGRATIATLRTLGEHVTAGEAAAVADAGFERELREAREQLPNEFAAPFEPDGLATDAG